MRSRASTRPPSSRVALAVRTAGGEPALLCVDAEASAVHDGAWLGLPEAEVHAEDRAAPADRIGQAEAVAALRGLFQATGILHAERAESCGPEARALLGESFARDVAEGAAHFRALGLRWRTRSVTAGAAVEAVGDVGRPPLQVYELSLEGPIRPRPVRGAWHPFEALWTAWAKGERVLAPELPSLVRRATGRWAESSAADPAGVWEVAPAVRALPVRTPTLPPAAHTNVFLIGSAAAVLVEPASPYGREVERIAEWVEDHADLGLSPQAILVTHHHPDHIGGARALSERLGLPLWGHHATADRLRGMVHFERLLEDGERIELGGPDPIALEAVHTPGHAPGHLCFLERRSGVMVAGDMVAGVGTILVEPTDGDMGLYLASLAKMEALAPTRLLPAHGGILADPTACLQRYVAHRLMREAKILAALAAAERRVSPAELVPVAYGDAPKSVWPLAVRSLEAHLLKLVAEGHAKRHEKGYEIC